MAERLELAGKRVKFPVEARFFTNLNSASLSSPFHRPEMTEILLDGRKTLTHLSILIKLFMSYAFTVIFIYFAKYLHYTVYESSIESIGKTCWSYLCNPQWVHLQTAVV